MLLNLTHNESNKVIEKPFNNHFTVIFHHVIFNIFFACESDGQALPVSMAAFLAPEAFQTCPRQGSASLRCMFGGTTRVTSFLLESTSVTTRLVG